LVFVFFQRVGIDFAGDAVSGRFEAGAGFAIAFGDFVQSYLMRPVEVVESSFAGERGGLVAFDVEGIDCMRWSGDLIEF